MVTSALNHCHEIRLLVWSYGPELPRLTVSVKMNGWRWLYVLQEHVNLWMGTLCEPWVCAWGYRVRLLSEQQSSLRNVPGKAQVTSCRPHERPPAQKSPRTRRTVSFVTLKPKVRFIKEVVVWKKLLQKLVGAFLTELYSSVIQTLFIQVSLSEPRD